MSEFGYAHTVQLRTKALYFYEEYGGGFYCIMPLLCRPLA